MINNFPQILMCKSPLLVSEGMKVLQINLPAIFLFLPLMKPPEKKLVCSVLDISVIKSA